MLLGGFWTAWGFLTVLPVPEDSSSRSFAYRMRRAIPYFPVVGMFLGLLLAGLQRVMVFIPPGPGGWLMVLASLILSRGLHLDGLADTADGVFVPADPARRREVMRDSRVGAFGVASVVLVLLGLQMGYAGILAGPEPWVWLVLAPAVSRWAMVVPMYVFCTPERDGGGMGELVLGRVSGEQLIFALAFTTLAAWGLAGAGGVAALGVATVLPLGLAALIRRRLEGLTGDVLGTVQMISELAFVFFVAFFFPVVPAI